MPAGTGFKLEKIMEAVDFYLEETGPKSRILIEYVVLADVNDGENHAHELASLLSGRRVTVNLIPYNPTLVDADYRKPDPKRVYAFRDVLMGQHGIRTTVRMTMGDSIASACGQLVVGSSSHGNADEVQG